MLFATLLALCTINLELSFSTLVLTLNLPFISLGWHIRMVSLCYQAQRDDMIVSSLIEDADHPEVNKVSGIAHTWHGFLTNVVRLPLIFDLKQAHVARSVSWSGCVCHVIKVVGWTYNHMTLEWAILRCDLFNEWSDSNEKHSAVADCVLECFAIAKAEIAIIHGTCPFICSVVMKKMIHSFFSGSERHQFCYVFT